MALFEVIVNGVTANQQIINRFNYVSDGTPIGVTLSFALLNAMGLLLTGVDDTFPEDGVGSAWQEAIGNSYTFLDASARNVYDPADFYTYPYLPGTVGDLTGNVLSPVMAAGLTSNRVRTDIRAGQKRIAGIRLADMSTEGQIVGGELVLLTALADAMGDTVAYTDGGNSLSFTPCIVSKEKYTAPSGKFAYRYYSTYAAQAAHLAVGISWLPKATIRTQGSRQYGRGS